MSIVFKPWEYVCAWAIFFGALVFASSVQALKVGDKAPVFKLTVMTNYGKVKRLSLAELRGKVVYLDFWAAWCGPCRKSLPALNSIRSELHDRGFEVLAVNLDEKTKDAVRFLLKHPVSYPIVVDKTGKTPRDYGVKGMPNAFLIDQKGIVRHIHRGFRERDVKEIRARILSLL